MPFPRSLSRRPATQTSEYDLFKPLHVQNRTKTVHAKALASERRAKFDPAEAMCKLNTIQLVMILAACRSEQGDSLTSVVFASYVESERF